MNNDISSFGGGMFGGGGFGAAANASFDPFSNNVFNNMANIQQMPVAQP